jgi:16S rRNA processing protein RimM
MERIATGRVRTTHGIHGYLKIQVFSGDYQNFLKHTSVWLKKGNQERQVTIEDSYIQGDSVLVKLTGINTPEAGKLYNGWEVWIEREESSPLDSGEFYQADLYGCDVVLEGEKVGTVVSIIEGLQADLFEIRLLPTDEDGADTSDSASLRYVPFMNEYIGTVDVQKRTVEILHRWIIE